MDAEDDQDLIVVNRPAVFSEVWHTGNVFNNEFAESFNVVDEETEDSVGHPAV